MLTLSQTKQAAGSLTDYVVSLTIKLSIFLLGVAILVAMLPAVVTCFWCLVMTVGSGYVLSVYGLLGLLAEIAVSALVGAMGWFGMIALESASNIETHPPTTSRTSHALPAKESLLRAASTPAAEARSELLRPSVEHEMRADQLLRSSQRDLM